MALYKRNCSICQVAQGNPKFRMRVRHAAFRRTEGEETLADIAAEFGLSVPSIYNHAKKHISDRADVNQQVREVKTARSIERIRAESQKEMELALESKVVDSLEGRPEEIIALDNYIAQGADFIRKGELKITATTFLAAVKIKNEWSSKRQGNKIEFMKTMAAFASGIKKPTEENKDGNTPGTTGDTSTGENESSDLHREAPWNAAAQRASRIPEADTISEQED